MKVLKPILGEPMIIRQLERLSRSLLLDQLVIATSQDASDDSLAELLVSRGYQVFRGDLNDVLDRFYQAMKHFAPEHVVRLTADCPLADPHLIDKMIEQHLRENNSYTSNCICRTFPIGLDAEVVSASALIHAWGHSKIASEREHVTLYIRNHPKEFQIGHFTQDENLSHLRWTVDEPEDLILIKSIYENLFPQNSKFGTPDILALLRSRPELLKLNSHIDANAGLNYSLENDRMKKSG